MTGSEHKRVRRTIVKVVSSHDLTAGIDPISGLQGVGVFSGHTQVLHTITAKKRRPVSIPFRLSIAYDLAGDTDRKRLTITSASKRT
jgi:hypothetical protein